MADWGFHRNKMEYFYNLCLLFCKNKQQQKITPHNLWNAGFPWIELSKSIKFWLLLNYSDLT